MRRHHHRAALGLEPQQEVGQAALLQVVEAAGRLVQQDDLRLSHEDGCQRHPLLLAAAKIAWVALRQRPQPEPLQQRQVARLVRRHPVALAG